MRISQTGTNNISFSEPPLPPLSLIGGREQPLDVIVVGIKPRLLTPAKCVLLFAGG